jgi:hypothetical protein
MQFACAALGVVLAPLALAAQEPKETNQSVKGKTQQVDDLRLTAVNVGKNIVPAMMWGDAEASHVFTLDENGVLRRISVPEFMETHQLDIGRKCEWLSRSSQWLVVAITQEVWLVDPATLQVKKKLPAASVKQAVSGPKLNLAYITNGKNLATLDFGKGKISAATLKGEFESIAVTADGNYLLAGSDRISRWKILKAGGVKLEEVGPVIASGRRGSGLMVSPDSQWVCLPTGGGNVTGLPLHPPAKTYATFVYPVKNLKKPDFVLEVGAYPEVVGFDPAAKLVYTQNADSSLVVCSATGLKQNQYRLKDARDVRQYLVHPEGRKLLLLTANQLLWVELAKK